MKRTTRTLAMPALLLSGLLVLSACGDDAMDDTTADAPPAADSAEDGGNEDGDNNGADVEFASGMVPHHQQAVMMSDMALEQGGPEVMALAEEIKAAQDPEIETMTQWLDAWGAEAPMDMEDMEDMEDMDMEGMMSAEDMENLMSAEGAEFDTMWLEMMIEHHNGAVMMGQTEVEEGSNADAIALAETIIETQEAEITEMEALLESTSG
ncbi:hypothetical protein BH24ACT8_BH24ACT8_15020 [soil metagenome]